MIQQIDVVKNEKGKPSKPCVHYPHKMVGSVECRGCTHHIKHNRENTVVWCSHETVENNNDAAMPKM